MAKIFPFNSVKGDRTYSAQDWRDLLKAIIPENGVIAVQNPDSLLVTAAGNNAVNVAPGAAFIYGAGYLQDETVQLTVPSSASGMLRTDLIIARYDYSARQITVRTLLGAEKASSPVTPSASRTTTLWDAVLASVSVTSTGISSVADTRGTSQNYVTLLWQDGIFPLPIALGGTGTTTAALARTSLALAATSHTHSTDDITTGALPIVRGGLGSVDTAKRGAVTFRDSACVVAEPPTASNTNMLGYYASGKYGFIPSQFLTGTRINTLWDRGAVDLSSISGANMATTCNKPGVYRVRVEPYTVGAPTVPSTNWALLINDTSLYNGVSYFGFSRFVQWTNSTLSYYIAKYPYSSASSWFAYASQSI